MTGRRVGIDRDPNESPAFAARVARAWHGNRSSEEVVMAKVPPAMWENPAAFTPDDAAENETERPGETAEPEGGEPDDGSFKRIAKEDDEAVEEPEEPRH